MRAASPPTTARTTAPRLRGRLGIDVSAQSVVLPPLPTSPPPQHVRLAQQQHDELAGVVRALRSRLEATRALVDLAPLGDAAAQRLAGHEHGGGDCFSAAKAAFARLDGDGDATAFLGQFLLELVVTIEDYAHSKRQHEAVAATRNPRDHVWPQQAHDHDHDDDDGDDGDDDGNDGNGSVGLQEKQHEPADESNSDASASSPHEPDSDGREENGDDDGATASPRDQDLRQVPATAVFRTTLRSRKFPASRVPPTEFVQTTSAHMPFDQLRRPPDLASLRLRGHDEFGSAQWSMVLFPKAKPSLRNHDEVDAFRHWATSKQSRLVASAADDEPTGRVAHEQDGEADRDDRHHDDDGRSLDAAFAASRRRFARALALHEHVCFELSRFVFDKCPTTARFLHGLFLQLVDVVQLTLANAEREHDIMAQRHTNVQLELARRHERLAKARTSLASLEHTLAKRQHMMLRERELIIRRRKTLNLLLCADQVLIRRIAGLIHHAQELGDEITTTTSSSRSQVTTSSSAAAPPETRFTLVDDVVSLVLDKFGGLHQLAKARDQEASRPHTPAEEICVQCTGSLSLPSDADRELIVLDTSSVKTAMDEYKATLVRLARIVAAKSPDSSVGWDAQELWDQALFIPPHEDVQDLERDVQRLCRHVEDRVLARRQQLARRDSVRTTAVQTDIDACLPRTAASVNQRWRARPFVHATEPPLPPPPSALAAPKWTWRRLEQKRKRNAGTAAGRDTEVSTATATATTTSQPVSSPASSLEDDHRDLLKTVVPDGFRPFIRSVPRDYTPQQLALHQVHRTISYLLNGIWMLVQDDFHRPPSFSTSSSRAGDGTRLIPLASIHEYVYRIYLQHFHVESVVASRILDLLVSASRLDTQSCKVQLFCRLLGVPGVAPFPSDGFWFVLKSLHVLQRCCLSTGGYFLLDAEGDNEFVPQASAAEALSQLFASSSNEVLKRVRLKLFGLASVYGTVWIPAYHILVFIMDEWNAAQDALRLVVEEKLFVEHASETDPFTGLRVCSDNAVSFPDFLRGFSILQLHVNRSEAGQAYRHLLLQSAAPPDSTLPREPTRPPRIDRHRFYGHWMELILHAVNVGHQQMVRPQNAGSASASVLGASGAGAAPSVQLGSIADAMASATQSLAVKFLVASWEQMKPEIIRRLDAKFNDVGLQVRLVQQMEATITRHQHAQAQTRDSSGAWRSFQQLLQIAYGKVEAHSGTPPRCQLLSWVDDHSSRCT